MWIIGGTMPIRAEADGRVAAASLVFDAAGKRVARYDKIHLFDVDIPGKAETYRESAHVAPGTKPVVVDTPAGKLGLSVCYDMRFPELFRRLSAAGAQIITRAVRVHRAHRARALGNTAACARHRKSVPRHRARAVGLSCERPRNLRRQHDRRSLGRACCSACLAGKAASWRTST